MLRTLLLVIILLSTVSAFLHNTLLFGIFTHLLSNVTLSGRALDLRSLGHRFDSHWGHLCSNLGQVAHTYVPLSPSSITGTGQNTATFFGWEGDRGPGKK